MRWWRSMWDILFSFASFVIAIGLGAVMGNLITGIPLDANGEYQGTLLDLIKPYTLLMGALTASLFLMHGTIFALMKTEGPFHDKIRKAVNPTIILFIMLYAITTVTTLIYYPHMGETIKERPAFFLVALINMFAIANIPREINFGRDGRAFLSSCFNIVCLLALYGIGSYPDVLMASNDPSLSLTIYNSASSKKTLEILHIIALIGVPMVISYTIAIYWIFRGKVRLDSMSY